MAIIHTMDDFEKITSNITSFSHAYLFDTNSLDKAFVYVKEFAKKIICSNVNEQEKEDILYKIDNNEFDDLYVVNPTTIGIGTGDVQKLLNYMETKSLRNDGKRVYIVYGFERLSRDVSNKILKFLEEPNDNIYALLMTENIDQLLSTIISRCQTIKLSFLLALDIDNLPLMQEFLNDIVKNKNKAIANYNEYFQKFFSSRQDFYNLFLLVERIISETINHLYFSNYQEEFYNKALAEFDSNTLIKILAITNHLKNLIKQNINLNLLLDRYIIEVVKELNACKK